MICVSGGVLRRWGVGNAIWGEPGGGEELGPLFVSQSQQPGASDDILAVTGPSSYALLPADERRTTHLDATRQFGVADPGASHVIGQKLGEGLQMLQLRYTETAKCHVNVVRSVHHPVRI